MRSTPLFRRAEKHRRRIRAGLNLPRIYQPQEVTDRKQLIIAGVVTEVCVAFPALSAIEGLGELFSNHIPNYRNLMTSFFVWK